MTIVHEKSSGRWWKVVGQIWTQITPREGVLASAMRGVKFEERQ